MLFMKKFLIILTLIFTLQTPSQADDIRDFQIEGISIGGSLLDFFTKKEIKESINQDAYEGSDGKFSLTNFDSSSDVYDILQIHFKTNDKNFLIYSIDGVFAFNKTTKECNTEKIEIKKSISDIFANLKEENIRIEMASGRGFLNRTQYIFKTGDFIEIVCYEYNTSDWINHGRVGAVREELEDWISSL